MSKLLSIIIPTYNMEALLPQCLNSLLTTEILNQLEVIIVNDGSKDNSLKIANEYKLKYPETIVVIDKPNGNYGSTINAALPITSGKYVKILDSDDYFDTNSLVLYLTKLQNIDVDIAVTHFTVLRADGKTELSKYNVYGKEPYEYEQVYELDNVLNDGYIRFFLMHALMYRTAMLRQMNYQQTEGISYTDLEWATYPMFVAKNIMFFNINLYQYNMAREGQTMSQQVMIRSVGQLEKVTSQLITFYDNYDKLTLSPIRLQFLQQYYLNRLRLVCKCYLFDMPRENFDIEHFAQIDAQYQTICKKFNFGTIKLYPENKILHFDAMAYWHRKHKRWPKWFEAVNSAFDSIIKFLYVKLFR